MKKFILFTLVVYLFNLSCLLTFASTGTTIESGSSNPFRDAYQFLRNPLYQNLRCGKREGETTPPSATIQLIRCAFDVLEVLKNFTLILMTIAIIGAAIYLISTPFFGLKNIGTAWNILIWTPVGMAIVFLGDIIKDQIERLLR